jgi:hypothetical protein
MKGLVKVGFTTKDPNLRAEKLNNTGVPHRYKVAYEVLVENPYDIEQSVHYRLSSYHENKEWFRCSEENAVQAIKEVVGTSFIAENYVSANEELVKRALVREREAKEKEKLIEARIASEERVIERAFENKIPKGHFLQGDYKEAFLILGLSALVSFLFYDNTTDAILGIIIVAIPMSLVISLVRVILDKVYGSEQERLRIVNDRENALKEIKEKVEVCATCGKRIRLDRITLSQKSKSEFLLSKLQN